MKKTVMQTSYHTRNTTEQLAKLVAKRRRALEGLPINIVTDTSK
jgi:hypothetical protein